MSSVLLCVLFYVESVTQEKKKTNLGQMVDSSLFYASELDGNGDRRSSQPLHPSAHLRCFQQPRYPLLQSLDPWELRMSSGLYA